MRKPATLCAAIVCAACVVAAQDQPGFPPPAETSATSAAPSPPGPPLPAGPGPAFSRWQLSFCYEYFRLRLAGGSASQNGINTAVTYYANEWFGIEGDTGPTFGSVTPNFKTKLLWYGGGPHLTYRHNGKLEPWAHVLFGGTHLNTSQAIGPTTFHGYAFMTGGGADFILKSWLAWRVQGDFVGTHLGGTWQRNFQFKSGIVLGF